jgi:hypothetical protein
MEFWYVLRTQLAARRVLLRQHRIRPVAEVPPPFQAFAFLFFPEHATLTFTSTTWVRRVAHLGRQDQ